MPITLLFGGSFDPVHHGHLITAVRAAEEIGAGRVLFIPAAVSPHKMHAAGGGPASGADRVAMLREAVAVIKSGGVRLEVSEFEVSRPPPSYTVETVEALTKGEPGEEFVLLIGADQLPKFGTWHRVGDLQKLVRVAVLGRPGSAYELPEEMGDVTALKTPLLEISATDVRARVKAGKSIAYLVPEGVERVIRERGLYR